MFADTSCVTLEPRFADLTAPLVESPDGLLEVSRRQFDARTGLLSLRVSPTDLAGHTVADLVVSGLDPALPRTVIQDGVTLPHHFSFRPTGPGWMPTSSGAIRLITTAAEHDIVVG